MKKEIQSLGELQACLKKCAQRLRAADQAVVTATRNAEKARDAYERSRRELDETVLAVKNTHRA